MFTTALTDDVLDSAADWSAQPITVQVQVRGRIDMRVFVVAKRVVAAVQGRAPAQVTDWRTDTKAITWSPIMVDGALAAACLKYVDELGLAYCALDFAADGTTTWFLEGNQAGEFSFVDKPLDLGVAQAVARHLASP
jgi:glutathione synthase/RimK-type ligase-like ATP-grasp enzyme